MNKLIVSENSHTELLFVNSFVIPEKRERWECLLKTRRGRDKIRSHLAHAPDIDPKFLQQKFMNNSMNEILGICKKRRFSNEVVIISEDSKMDGKKLELENALKIFFGKGIGVIFCFENGKAGYYEGEGNGDRFLFYKE